VCRVADLPRSCSLALASGGAVVRIEEVRDEVANALRRRSLLGGLRRGYAELGQEAAVVGLHHSSASRPWSWYLYVLITSHSRCWPYASGGIVDAQTR
jgi:hypothetical protein